MRFRGQYYFLSNMYPCTITIQLDWDTTARTYPCAECAFQAAKNPKEAEMFTEMNGFEAKKAGRRVRIVPSLQSWERRKVGIMKSIIHAKFSQHPEQARQLTDIQGVIQEDNTWNDTFWGVCNGRGENHLGKILMDERDLQKQI